MNLVITKGHPNKYALTAYLEVLTWILEVLTWILYSYRESFTMLNCKDGKSTAFIIGNHGSPDLKKVMRSSLIDVMLKTVAHNKDHPKPIKVTERYRVVPKLHSRTN